MSLDLVSAKGKWAAGIKELRELLIRVEQDGFSMQSQAVWRLHWDHQIYKVSKWPELNVSQCPGVHAGVSYVLAKFLKLLAVSRACPVSPAPHQSLHVTFSTLGLTD